MKRILIIDDIAKIREDFRETMNPVPSPEQRLRELMSGKAATESEYQIDEASQGMEGVAKVQLAIEENRPYDAIVVDMFMPPGIDGETTIRRIRTIDPHVCIVGCTGYTDIAASTLADANGGKTLPLLYKPFNRHMLLQAFAGCSSMDGA